MSTAILSSDPLCLAERCDRCGKLSDSVKSEKIGAILDGER